MEDNFSSCGDREREGSFPGVGGISNGRALCHRGGEGVQSTVGGGMMGFALGVTEVGGLFSAQRKRWGGVPSTGSAASG